MTAEIPVSFYIINYTNNTFSVQVGATVYSIVITRGNYSSKTLITEILTKFSQVGLTTMQIVISAVTGCLTFTNTSAFTILSSGTINTVLGFATGTAYTSTLNSILAPYPLNLLGILRLRFVSDDLQIESYDSQLLANYPVLCSIPVTVGAFGCILYNNYSGTKTRLSNEYLAGFNLRVLDDQGNLVNFNNQNWTLTISLDIYRSDQTYKSMSTVPTITYQPNNLADNLEGGPDSGQDGQQEEVIPPPEYDDTNNLDVLLYNLQ